VTIGAVFLTVALMGLVTLTCRYLPFAVMGKLRLGAGWVSWMRYLPIAVLASVVAPQIFGLESGLPSWKFFAALPTVFVAMATRNLLFAVGTGIACVSLLRGFSG
jgi:branched-subunit amino acid transport protein